MLPGDHLPVDQTEGLNDTAKGSASLKHTEEIPPSHDPVSRGNTTDLISSQPAPAAAPPAEASQESSESQKPTCPRCGLIVSDHRASPRVPAGSRLQSSSLSVHSSSSKRSRRSRSSAATSQTHTDTPADTCLHLLLACLFCQWSVLLLGVLEACSSCLSSLCSSCCCACARCCSAVQETPMEELNCNVHCHSVMFESCCEPTECLEFCLECCEICHRS